MASSASQGMTTLLILLLLLTRFSSSHPLLHQHSAISSNSVRSSDDSNRGCSGIYEVENYEAKCKYLEASNSQCEPEGYINYLYLFYCLCGKWPVFGYTLLIILLGLLFYLLGSTAANYFCSNLEGLSRLLKLSPTIAGVTLLSLGNGAPDVFSSIVSFMGSTSTNLIGLNSVLGGAFFVSSVVVGIISICTSDRKISINKSCFVRDVCFLLFVLLVILAIIIIGEINVWCAIAFSSLYFVYVFLVSMTYLYGTEEKKADSLLPIEGELLGVPLLSRISKRDDKIPTTISLYYLRKFLYLLQLPLYLPRRLTIPDINEEKWSKPFAVSSVTLSPILLAFLWDSKREELGSKRSLIIFGFGGLVGVVLGVTVIMKTEKEKPPTRFLFPWLAGGFLMSVTWTYIIAEELVSVLVSVGLMLNISPSILGLTVLAWGNSLGDLIANVAVALNGQSSGAQVAISGCYGGPIFNTLVGLGIPLVLTSVAGYPASMAIPKDTTLFQTLGFLAAGLLWALLILPRREMKLDKFLGIGLIAIYLCFLSLRLSQSLGLI